MKIDYVLPYYFINMFIYIVFPSVHKINLNDTKINPLRTRGANSRPRI